MYHTARFALIVAAIAAAGVGLSGASVLAQQGQQMGPGIHDMGPGMGPGMMGPDSEQGPGMMGPDSGEGGGMMGRGMSGMMGMMGGCPMMGGGSMYPEGRVAFLKAELAITDAQASVWEAYAAALKQNMQSMQGMRETMKAARAGKTPVERLDAHVTAMEGRLQALKDLKPMLTSLYDALSDDQKKKADQLLTGMGCMM
jgi:hypothetical protein